MPDHGGARPGPHPGRPRRLRPDYTVADALRDAHAALDGARRKPIPTMAARRLVATVEAWRGRIAELEEDRERYVELVEEWNCVCEATRAIGIDVSSHDGLIWLWSYDEQSGEEATPGAAIAAALRVIAAR